MNPIKTIAMQTINALIDKQHPRAIDTYYAKRYFRSRLEARWAVFFDALGIKWDYEREGFELNGIRFLPDFWLENVTIRAKQEPGLWVEIKPTFDALHENEQKFWILDQPLVVFVGNPPGDSDTGYEYSNEDHGAFWDNEMRIMKCPMCGHIKIDHDITTYWNCPKCEVVMDNRWFEDERDLIFAASIKALSMRF